MIILLIVAGYSAAMAQTTISYNGSVQYATGKYMFTERTDSFYFVNGLSFTGPQSGLSFSIPLISQNSPWISYSGIGVTPTGGKEHGKLDHGGKNGDGGGGSGGGGKMKTPAQNDLVQSETIPLQDTLSYSKTGFGDPSVSVYTQLLQERPNQPGIRALGNVKLPVADLDRGYGTGEWDFGAGLNISKRFENTFLFLDAMYWWLGDLPDLELKNPVSFGIAWGQALIPQKLSSMVSVNGYSEIIEGIDPPLSLNTGLNYWFGNGHGLNGSLSFGLSDSSPDFSATFGWRFQF